MSQATLSLLADSSQIKTATNDLKSLSNEGAKTQSTAQRIEQQFTKLTTASKSAAASASAFANALTTVNQDLGEARNNIENFISDQIKLGRTIDENGNVISASGNKIDVLSDDLQRLRSEYLNTSNQSDELAEAMNRINSATDKNQAAAQDAASAQARLEKELKDSQVAARAQARALGESTVAAQKSSSSVANFGRSAGQAGIQVQQFVGQVSGGQNAMLALSQQSADLGIVLGAPLIGVATSFAATALLMAQDTEAAATSADKLETALETLSQTANLGANGLIEYTEEIRKLAEVSQLAASGRVEAAIEAANKAALNAARSVSETIEDELNLNGFFADLEGAVASARASLDGSLNLSAGFGENIAIADALAEKLGITGENARQAGAEIVELIAKAQTARTPEAFIELEERLNGLREGAGIVATETINNLINAISPFINKGIQAGETARKLGEDLQDGVVDAGEDASKSANNLTTSLQAQIIALQGGAQAAEVYAATQNAIQQGTESLLPKQIELINQKYELIRAQEAAAEAARQEIEQQKAYESVLDSIFKNQERIEAQKLRETEQRQANFESLRQQIVLQQQQLTLDNEQYELRRNLLALGDGANQSQIDEIIALTEQMQQLRLEAEILGPTLENSLQTIGLDAMDSLSQGLANVITEGESLRDVLGSVANTILNELLTAVIRYAIGAAAQSVIGQSIATTAAVTSAATIAAAATPAAIAMNIATLGGAATAAAASSAAAIPTMAGLISGSALAGFEKGGYTGNYGTKEVAGVVHGQEFVMNAKATRKNRGALEAMNKGESIGGNTYVNVTNNATNSDVSTEERQDAQGNRVIDIVVNNINQRGKIHRAMTQTTTASNRL